jgi:hypothetical protein
MILPSAVDLRVSELLRQEISHCRFINPGKYSPNTCAEASLISSADLMVVYTIFILDVGVEETAWLCWVLHGETVTELGATIGVEDAILPVGVGDQGILTIVAGGRGASDGAIAEEYSSVSIDRLESSLHVVGVGACNDDLELPAVLSKVVCLRLYQETAVEGGLDVGSRRV